MMSSERRRSTSQQRDRSPSASGSAHQVLKQQYAPTSSTSTTTSPPIQSSPFTVQQQTLNNNIAFLDPNNGLGLESGTIFASDGSTSSIDPSNTATLYNTSDSTFYPNIEQSHQQQRFLQTGPVNPPTNSYQQQQSLLNNTSSTLDSQNYSTSAQQEQQQRQLRQQVQNSYGAFLFDTTLDPGLLDQQAFGQPGGSSVAAAANTNTPSTNDQTLNGPNMADMHQSNPQPPHLLSPGLAIHSNSSSPITQQGAGFGAGPSMHSRNSSLDPASAAYSHHTGSEWTAFGTHRRTPSDQNSDVSSSAHPSPYLDNSDTFDLQGSSPMLAGQRDSAVLPASFTLGAFSLADQDPSQTAYISPGVSGHPSPALAADPFGMSQINGVDDFSLLNAGDTFDGVLMPDATLFPTIPDPRADQSGAEFGHGTQSPPEISIHPPDQQLQPLRNPQINLPEDDPHSNTLSPPGSGFARPRAKSDPHSNKADSKANATMNRSRSPSVGGLVPSSAGSSRSRSTSPSAPINGINKDNRRTSSPGFTNAQNAQYIARVADGRTTPDPTGYESGSAQPGTSPIGSTSGGKRQQRHPATFQCHLCPKRFTRAYNLRSHLRTHTDERPFVCTICGKAFARQHDRRRHEGLHTGEKKFVCRGTLANGAGQWGCGRRFARADALGRHFRSEAGRTCIKPLLDEEARNQTNALMNQAGRDLLGPAQPQPGNMQHMPQPIVPSQPLAPVEFASGLALPAALLEQYPALATIQWDVDPGVGSSVTAAALTSNNDNNNASFDDGFEEADFDHSSFEAGSNNEFYDDEESGYISGQGMDNNGAGFQLGSSQWGNNQGDGPDGAHVTGGGWSSDVGEGGRY